MISKSSCLANTCWEFEKMWEISKMKTLGGYIFGPIFRWPVERQIPWHSLHGSDNPGSGQFPRRYISRYHFLTAWKWYHLQHLGCISYWEFAMETVVRRKNFDTHIMDSSCWVATTCHILSFIDFTSCVYDFEVLFLDIHRASQFFHLPKEPDNSTSICKLWCLWIIYSINHLDYEWWVWKMALPFRLVVYCWWRIQPGNQLNISELTVFILCYL